jgi:CRP/FNR family cyclic AMP-dependent transcriptional regulator
LLEAAHDGRLGATPFLRNMDRPSLANLLRGAHAVRLERGQVLALRGSWPGRCWLLLSGYVKEHRANDDGSEAISGFRGPGDLVAEMQALARTACDLDATALSHGEALGLPLEHVRRLVGEDEQTRTALLHAVADRARRAEVALTRTHVGHASERVALAILELSCRWGVPTEVGTMISLPLSQTELAGWVGTSRETAARALHELRRDGVVETSRRRIVIRDPSSLRRTAGVEPRMTLVVPA